MHNEKQLIAQIASKIINKGKLNQMERVYVMLRQGNSVPAYRFARAIPMILRYGSRIHELRSKYNVNITTVIEHVDGVCCTGYKLGKR